MSINPRLKKIRLGDLLLNAGVVNELQLQKALKIQETQGGRIGDILVAEKYVSEMDIAKVLSDQLKIPFFDLNTYNINYETLLKLPEKISRKAKALLLEEQEKEYVVGMVDPTDIISLDEIQEFLGKKLQVVLIIPRDYLKIADQVYRRTEEIRGLAEELKGAITTGVDLSEGAETLGAEAAPVTKLLESMFEDAVQVGASDIHIEPDESVLRIRQRVDGVLQEHILPRKEIAAALVIKIKLIAKLNISEKRIPQDGRFALNIRNHSIDVRVSTMPIRYGESVVMRLLDQSSGILKIDQLGMPDEILQRILYLIHRPNGMILVTGPTGSGKTTTMYAAIHELNSSEKKIITIEDPVEYTLPRVNQVQVNPNIGLTFSSVLRSALRQDPNIIMVGEMRDEETVNIGLRASLTGHLVMSTLHTNDSISSAMRLIDMGAQGFLVAGGLRCVIAQRLMRKICEHCKTKHILTRTEKAWLQNLLFIDEDLDKIAFKTGPGCSRCGKSGYQGRVAIYEMLEIDPSLAEGLRNNDPQEFTERAHQQKNFKPLAESAFALAREGITTVEEVLRVAVI